MSESNKQVTRRVLEELFDKGNLDAADELIHPEFVNHEAPPDNPQGPEGEFLGKPPSGNEFAVEHIHIWRIEDGKVVEHWSVRDDLGQALQLGLIGG